MIAKHFLKRVFRYNLRTKKTRDRYPKKMFESLIPRVREREKKHAVQCCHLVHLYRTKPPSIMQYTLLSFGDSSHTFFLLFFFLFSFYILIELKCYSRSYNKQTRERNYFIDRAIKYRLQRYR